MYKRKQQRIKFMLGAVILAAFLSLSGTVSALDLGALPTGGKIVSGIGNIFSVGRQMTVNQNSEKMIATWDTFDIGKKASVTFQQPDADSVALNKIYDQNPSQILGTLSANGKIYLINPSGIVFGKDAQVNVGGLVASSLNMLDSDFLAGKYTFFNDGNAGSVINKGSITAANGGVVALLAPKVSNEGTITANGGTVLLGAGNQVTLDFTGDGLISYTIDKGAVDALAENSGLIKADGGKVVMTAKAADALTSAVVNNSGVIEAKTLENKGGRIILMSDMANGKTLVGGKLDASAPNGGDSGFVETSGAEVKVADGTVVTTLAPYGTNGTWLIDPPSPNFNIAASGGDITGATLSSNLGLGNVAISSTSGSTGSNGNINVNDTVTWSANKLTLTAINDVNINAVMTAGDTASLDLEPGSSNVNVGMNAKGSFIGRVDFPDRSGTGFLTINGNSYTVINSLGVAGSYTGTDLQGMNGNLSGYYALGSNINASATKKWNPVGDGTYDGFLPIGNSGTNFTGQFDGLGHTITNLTINWPSAHWIGLFGYINKGIVRNVGLVGGKISGSNNVGELVGYNFQSMITNVYATGSVSGSYNVGGLVGYSTTSSTVMNAHATGKVSASNDYVGGLVGYNNGTVTNAYATGSISSIGNSVGGLIGYNTVGSVSSSSSTGKVVGLGSYVGGLIGENQNSTITNTHATGKVTGSGDQVGGLIGYNNSGSVSSSYAISKVKGLGNFVGGLIGQNYKGTVSSSYATGNVSGISQVGGLIGNNDQSTVSNSFATGKVKGSPGSWNVGGLVGSNSQSTVSNSYATGNVSGTNQVGGLVGGNGNYSTVSNSYSIGKVKGESSVGGLVGYDNANYNTVTNSYWNTTTSGQTTSAGGSGLTTAQMMQQANFSGWDFTTIWDIIEGVTYPTLR